MILPVTCSQHIVSLEVVSFVDQDYRYKLLYAYSFFVGCRYFAILHLDIIKLKHQKCDVTKLRIPPLLDTQCHTSSTPSAPLNVT